MLFYAKVFEPPIIFTNYERPDTKYGHNFCKANVRVVVTE